MLRILDLSSRTYVAQVQVGNAGLACLLTEASLFMVRRSRRNVIHSEVIFGGKGRHTVHHIFNLPGLAA
jgi:hypothetical protein